MNRLLTHSARPALCCWFVQGRQNWLAGTCRFLNPDPLVIFRARSAVDQLPEAQISGSLVVLEYQGDPWPQFLGTIIELTRRRVAIVAAGDGKLNSRRTALTMAGACLVATSLADCQPLAALIQRARERQPYQLLDWQEDFRQRIPWPRPGSARQ